MPGRYVGRYVEEAALRASSITCPILLICTNAQTFYELNLVRACVCVCVCQRVRLTERDRDRETDREIKPL